MAPFGLKLWEDAFQTIPNISFFDAENVGNKSIFYKTLIVRLPPKDGSVRPQTLGKRVSDDPRHFIFRRRTKKIDKNFRQKKIAAPSNPENWQTACFGGAVNFRTSMADAPRKFIARTIGFSLLRPLAEG